MKRRAKYYLLLALVCGAGTISADDSIGVVTLSPRVGAVIDVQEKVTFGLFSHIPRFIRAVFYINKDSAFYCIVTSQAGTATTDTIIPYGRYMLLMIAEKINHYEELKAGRYTMGSDPAKLEIVGGSKIGHGPGMLQHKNYNDVLPLAGFAAVGDNPDDFPCMSFGVGLSSYYPDFSGLNSAFNTIEDRYRSRRFAVPHISPGIDTHTLFSLLLGVHFSGKSSLLFEATSVDNIKMLSAHYLYRFAQIRPWFHLLAGGGIGQYHFSGRVPYNQPIDTNYHYLDEINYKGGGIGYSLLVGMEIGSINNVRASIIAKNLYVPPIETTLSEGVKATLMLGSFMVEGKFEVAL